MSDKEDTPDEGLDTTGEMRGSTFDIGTQRGDSIQNVGGDVRIALRWELAQLADEIERVKLPASVRVAVEGALTEAATEAAGAQPDPDRIASSLGRAVQALSETGELQTAEASLVEAFRRPAVLLGQQAKHFWRLCRSPEAQTFFPREAPMFRISENGLGVSH